MASVKITNPALPLWENIPGGLTVGKLIKINGIFPSYFDVSEYSKINLCEYSPDVIPLHLSIRFNHRKVIRNTFERNDWGTEERDGPFTFAQGKQFLIQILVQQHGYQISVNGQHCWTFAHRLPYVRVTHLNIDGPLIVWSVEFATSIPQVSPSPVTTSLGSNPSLPYWVNLPQRLSVGNMVKIKGFFPAQTDRSEYTSMNLCQNSKSTIAFHLSIRFNSNVTVRNSFRYSGWENEERGGPFPFALGKEFLIQILVKSDAYQISVNGAHCWMFFHRLPFEVVNGLNIDGPVKIRHVEYVQVPQQQNYHHMPPQQPQVVYQAPPAPSSLEPVYNPVHNQLPVWPKRFVF